MSVIAESVYDELARIAESCSFRRESLQLAATRFPRIPDESLLSIYSQLVRLHTKRTYWQHNKPKTKLQYYQMYLMARDTETGSADVLLQLAEKVCLSPALYARIILEQFATEGATDTSAIPSSTTTSGTPTPSTTNTTTTLTSGTPIPSTTNTTTTPTNTSGTPIPSTTNTTTTPTNTSGTPIPSTTTPTNTSGTPTPSMTNTTTSTPLTTNSTTPAALATPTTAVTTPTTISVSTLVNQWMKNPLTIPDIHLQLHVRTCILKDTHYGPLAENMKRSVGYEFEFFLREKVQELAVPFLDEEGLRARGYDKTPDVKLEVPVAVDGHIVNWIESKASFGDRTSHEKYMEDQYWSYQNRYGSGLVIYWFGYVAELNSFQDQGILLMERFPDPTQITKLNSILSLTLPLPPLPLPPPHYSPH